MNRPATDANTFERTGSERSATSARRLDVEAIAKCNSAGFIISRQRGGGRCACVRTR